MPWSAEWVSAVAGVLSAVAGVVSATGVILAFRQLRLMKQMATTEFEDGFNREYRDLIGRLPTKAILGEELTDDEHRQALDELIHYIDLCNEQVFLHRQGRISAITWATWREGILANMQRPAFARAWREVQDRRPGNFQELERLLAVEPSPALRDAPKTDGRPIVSPPAR